MGIQLMDCTLRDGGNVVGSGFPADLEDMMLDGLTSIGIPYIEFGNSKGIGGYELGFTDCLTDDEYFAIAKKYYGRGSMLGMFLNATRFKQANVDKAKENGIDFLRVGANAGDSELSLPVVSAVKKAGLKAFYSLMKAYILTPDELAEEGKKLEAAGLDEITIMDSAGTMLPDQVAVYTEKLSKAVSIPVAFHCHNNLGLSAANAIAAYQNGARILDCGLMGMARSAGNLATEVCMAIMQRYGEMKEYDMYKMLDFIENRLQPAMEKHGYHNPIKPLDLALGISGCHSSFVKRFKAVAAEKQVNLFRLIIEVSAIDQKKPSEELMRQVADKIKAEI